MLNSEEIIAAIHGSYATGSKNGFQNVLTLLDKMHVALRTPIVHVAGTNGKGSTCAMLESVLRRAGYHTGLYTSPFLQAYQERIRLDGLPLDDARMVKYGNPLVQAAEEMRAEGAFVTPFEMGTALALAAFDGENCDIAIVEVGMGGRKDPTNIVHPILCAITAIGLDHMAYLGNTLEAIAGEKAGIIKDNTPVVCHPAKEGVRRVFAEAAEKHHAPLRQLSDDTILYAACFDANGGVFEPLFGEQDAIISDALNHASIIDGVRLCKAVRYRYANADMADLEECLKKAQAQRFRIICTDGVFSMDGNAAPLDKICALAEKYDALVMVDECHSAGVLGKTGRGITELYDRRGQVDILTGTLGKAFGGAVGGFTTGRREIIDMLRQRSRPYLFSNSLPPAVVGAGIEMFRMLAESNELHDLLVANVEHFREGMMAAGFDIKPTQSAICAVMLYDAKLSQDFAARLQDEGVFVTGFYYPVVPKGQARIRVQVSAGHTTDQLDRCIAAFTKVGKELNVIK